MKWVENTDYPKVFDGQSIKIVNPIMLLQGVSQ